jgi:hypothetical protein
MIKIFLSLAWSKIKAINWKKLAPYIIILILAILLLLNYLKLRSVEQDKVRYYGNFITTDKEYKDAQGKWVRETSALVITNKELQTMIENGNTELQHKMDIIKAMGIKIKNLESIGSSGFYIHDTILIPYYLAMPDTASGHFYFSDGYFSMDLSTCAETGTQMVYDYKDTLTWTANAYFKDKWKFKNIFKPRDKYIKLNSQLANPKARITSQEYYKIKGKIKRLVE